MTFYLRKLKHQELGYSEGKGGGQRGRYILIAKMTNNFFPIFPEDINEPHLSVPLVNPSSKKAVYCEYVFHNGSAHRGKDWRMYLNKDLITNYEEFRPNDYLLFYKYPKKLNNESLYLIFYFNQFHQEYLKFENLKTKSHSVHENIDFIDIPELNISSVKFNLSEKTLTRVGRKGVNNEESTCSESEFKKFVKNAYDNKCAVTGENILIPDLNDLSAVKYQNNVVAHIRPDVHDGPFRPDNGILFSQDIHWAFDYGAFSINDDFTIKVHENAQGSMLKKFNGKKISLPEQDELKPNLEYIRFHREKVFGSFKPLRS